MSGFYGKVLYQYTRLFDTVNITPYNTEQDALSVPEDNDAITLAAGKAWDTLYFGPANHWIQLNTAEAQDAANNNIEIITIGHSLPSDETSDNISCASTKPEEIEDEDIINIKNGDYFLVRQKFDKAGHLNTTNPTYYRMPITTINIGTSTDSEGTTVDLDIIPKTDTDKLYFNGDNIWISLTKEGEGALHFNHTKLQLLPQFKNVSPEDDTIALDNWIVSYDNGASWNEIKDEEGNVYPTKTTIKVGETEVEKAIPKPWTALNFEQTDSLCSRYSYYPTAISMPAYNSNSIISVKELEDEISLHAHRYDQSIQDYLGTLDDDTKIYTLHQGDILETQHIIRDQLGHILSVQPMYLQLPYSDTNQSITDMTNDLFKINKYLSGEFQDENGDWVEKHNSYEENLDLLVEINTFLTTGFSPDAVWYPENLSMLTGTLTDMYTTTTVNPNTAEEELIYKDKTLASTIGVMDGENGLINKVNAFCTKTAGFYSLSSAIQEILSTQTQKNEVLDSHTVDLSQIRTKSMPAIVKILNLIDTDHLSETEQQVYDQQLTILNTLYETATS